MNLDTVNQSVLVTAHGFAVCWWWTHNASTLNALLASFTIFEDALVATDHVNDISCT